MKCPFKITLKKAKVTLKVGWYACVCGGGREEKKRPFKILLKKGKGCLKSGVMCM